MPLCRKIWMIVIPDTLLSIRSFPSTATNSTPYERFFNFKRRFSFGTSLPTWVTSLGLVLLRQFARNKNDPVVNEVELMDAKPSYAIIKHKDGRESISSIRDRKYWYDKGTLWSSLWSERKSWILKMSLPLLINSPSSIR